MPGVRREETPPGMPVSFSEIYIIVMTTLV
jgi:hypothetical protein